MIVPQEKKYQVLIKITWYIELGFRMSWYAVYNARPKTNLLFPFFVSGCAAFMSKFVQAEITEGIRSC